MTNLNYTYIAVWAEYVLFSALHNHNDQNKMTNLNYIYVAEYVLFSAKKASNLMKLGNVDAEFSICSTEINNIIVFFAYWAMGNNSIHFWIRFLFSVSKFIILNCNISTDRYILIVIALEINLLCRITATNIFGGFLGTGGAY